MLVHILWFVNVKIIFKFVKMINFISDRKFINVIFYFAYSIRVYPLLFFNS